MEMVRIQFELPEDKVRELEKIMKESRLATRKDLFNNALTLFEWAIRERKKGKIIASIDERNQSFKEIVMPSLESVSRKEEENLVDEELVSANAFA